MRYVVRPLRNALLMGVWAGAPAGMTAVAQTTSALSVPLFLPVSVAFDTQGDLYFAETNRHVVRKVDLTGALTTVAGDGTQGFSGDGGPATAAELDSPAAIAVDGANTLYVADAHNGRIRRVDGTTGVITTLAGNGAAGASGDGGAAAQAGVGQPSSLALDGAGNLFFADVNNHRIRKVALGAGTISTVAGNGQQGFAGDGGLATAAALDSPGGLAVDAAGNLYIADTRNHRVRLIRAATGVISTMAGTGTAGFSGDNAGANGAALALPRGVSVDSAGNVTIADTNNQRVRRISATGTITTAAGDGTQAFAGDGGAAVSASLDTPRGVAASSAGLLTIADTGNQRVRQVAVNATIATIAGLGQLAGGTLSLAGPAMAVYGTGTFVATLASSMAGTGSVALFDGNALLASTALVGGSAGFSTASLAVGTHTLQAVYTGDTLHAAAQSAAMLLTVTPAPLTLTANSASLLYGQSVPPLTGTLAGVLAQDAGKIAPVLATAAAALSPPGSYAITGGLSGPAAGNYALAPVTGASLTIAKAPSAVTLTAAQSVVAGQPLGVTAHVASTTSGVPGGSITLLDGGAPVATLPLGATGDASYTSSAFAAGAHTLTASYSGDGNFLPSASAGQPVVVTSAVAADFALAVTGTASQTVAAGGAAVFPFAVQMQGAALSSPITLAASSLPVGVTASFSPNYLPPGGEVTTFTLTLQTPKTVAAGPAIRMTGFALAALFAPLLGFALRGRRLLAAGLSMALLVSTTGCGARVFALGATAAASASYPITVTGTATAPSGSALTHAVTVTLTVQ